MGQFGTSINGYYVFTVIFINGIAAVVIVLRLVTHGCCLKSKDNCYKAALSL